VLIVSIAIGAITFIMLYIETGSFMEWFKTPSFVNTVVIVVIVMIATKILKGGAIQVPENPTGKKTEFNIPDTWGVKKFNKPILQSTNRQPQQKTTKLQSRKNIKPVLKYVGTWTCSKCGFLAKGDKCAKCGKTR